ncbi:MAG: hypothetical protein FWD17_19875 [Polyangiaceae bacterium]|nr:hypothetical protein [Polyangiaceae bacterium]
MTRLAVAHGRTFLFAVTLAAQLAACARPPPPAPPSRAALASPQVVPGELDAKGLLGDLPGRASRLGAGAVSVVASVPAVDNAWVGGFVTVPVDACVLAYARAASSVGDVDVAVYSDEGTSLAVDEGRDTHPTVLLCPPHPDRIYVAAHVVEGEGLVAVGAQLVPRERAALVARAFGARGATQAPRPADAWPGLADAVRAHRAALGGTWDELKRIALPVDARMPTFAAMPIEADHCVDAIVVPDDDVDLLDVEVIDEGGRVVARARDGSGTRDVTVCSPVAMPAMLSVRPRIGRGLAALVLARASEEVARDLSAKPDVAWAAPTQPIETVRAARNALLAKSGYAPAFSASAGTLALGRRATLPLDLQALPQGACARIDVVAGAPLSLVDARVRSDTGALLAADEASLSSTLFTCTRGPAHLELDTRGRPGPFAVLVRAEPWRSDAFAGRPLAASRMLARAALGPAMLLSGKDVGTREVGLDAGHLVAWTDNVPPDRCLRVTAGVQGTGAGVDLRAFDGTDDEVDRSHGAYAASVRVCARADAGRAIRFELSADAGHLDGVVGERVAPLIEGR